MVNVQTQTSKDGNTLTITVDLRQTHGLSKSGKTMTIGSTKGNQGIGPGADGAPVFVGVNVYRHATDTERAERVVSGE